MTGIFGRDETRADGVLKATGAARYVADRPAAGSLLARYVAATVPHGVIRRIDVDAASRVPGVHAILTGEDVRGVRVGRRLQDWPLLAWDRVRFVGERIAAIAAETPEAADRAADLIEVDIEQLPPVLDPVAAVAPGAPVLHPDAATYRYLWPAPRPSVSHPNIQGELESATGIAATDADGFAALFLPPNRVFEGRYETGRQHQGYLETHAARVTPTAGGGASIVTTNKQPFGLRSQMSAALDMPVEILEVETDSIGGDFGGKGLSIDEYLCLLLARRTGRPVHAAASYAEELTAYAPRHAGRLRLRTAVDADGRIVAHDAQIDFDGGAYAAAKPLPELILPGALDVLAAYHVPHRRIRTRVVYTNTVPGGHMRCPGELQAAFAGESHVDAIARELGFEPIAFRRRNAAGPETVTAHHQRIRTPMAVEVLDRLERELPGASRDGGRGVALVARRMEGGRGAMRARVLEDGRVALLTSLPDQGAGLYAALSRIAAATLGLPEESVTVLRRPTSDAAADLGVGASRVTFLAGRATQDAVGRLRAAMEDAASVVAGDRVELRDGAFTTPTGVHLSWAAVAALPAVIGLQVEGTYDSEADGHDVADFTFGGLGVIVDVDRETGVIDIRDAVFVADAGSAVINPLAHRGQIDGGFAQGIGAAMMEELVFDDGQVANATLADYRLPVPEDVPLLRTVLLTSSAGPGPFGTKMAGELSPSAVAPAIANAVADATGMRPSVIPMTPERVLRALRSDRSPETSRPAQPDIDTEDC